MQVFSDDFEPLEHDAMEDNSFPLSKTIEVIDSPDEVRQSYILLKLKALILFQGSLVIPLILNSLKLIFLCFSLAFGGLRLLY